MLVRHSSMYDLMQEFLPQLNWEPFKNGPPLSVEQILELADAHFAEHGTWPHSHSSQGAGTNLTWSGVNERLRGGYCGFRAGSSLPALLAQHRGVQSGKRPPPLTEQQILAWADAFHAVHGQWPTAKSGLIAETRETWSGIDNALRSGLRDLQAGSSLARLLDLRRGVRNSQCLPKLSEPKIVAWARAFHRATGRWPTCRSGLVLNSLGETWASIEFALSQGRRGLPGGSSVHKLLKAHGLK